MKIILKRIVQIGVTCGLLTLVGMLVWNKVLDPSPKSKAQKRPAATAGTPLKKHVDWRQVGDRAYYKRDWNTAVDAYQRELRRHPKNLPALVRMAYALHSAGRLDEALEAHVKASRSQHARSWSLYNIACVYAVKNEPELALEYLRQAIEAGFRDTRPMREDPDLASLIGNPEFEQLEELAKPIQMRDVYHRIDFLIGNWLIIGTDEEREGSFGMHRDMSRFATKGIYADAARPFTATVTAYFDPRIGKWRQLWLESGGNVIDLTETNSSFSGMELSGNWIYANGDQYDTKMRFERTSDDSMIVSLLVSRDSRVTWETVFKTTLERVPEGARIKAGK